MTTEAYEHALEAGETLIADLSLVAVPFGWTADVPDGTTVARDCSISKAADNWITPVENATLTEDVQDYELDPLRFMRFRHQSGAGTATIRIGCIGRVEWSVS